MWEHFLLINIIKAEEIFGVGWGGVQEGVG